MEILAKINFRLKKLRKLYISRPIYPAMAVLIGPGLKIFLKSYRNHPKIVFLIFLEDGYNFRLDIEYDSIRLPGLSHGSEPYGI
jgi:hypothetical protein